MESMHLCVQETIDQLEAKVSMDPSHSSLLYVVEISPRQELEFHIINCTHKNFTLRASRVKANIVGLCATDDRQMTAVRSVNLQLSGEPIKIGAPDDKERHNAISFDLNDFASIQPNLLREGALVIEVAFRLDGHSQSTYAYISCPRAITR